MNVSTPDRTSRVIHLVAWIVVLLISTLPNILLQEVFGRPVSSSMKVILSVGVIAAAFVASLAWRPLRMLYPLLVLCSVLTVGQWLVYTRIDELAFIANRLEGPVVQRLHVCRAVAEPDRHGARDCPRWSS